MTLHATPRPKWLTFDCYGTLIQWDEGLQAAVRNILAMKPRHDVDPARLIAVYDRHEHALEQTPPHRTFREVAGAGLRLAMEELNLPSAPGDTELLTGRISAMPPFGEVVDTLRQLKESGYRLCIVSNTDDDIIAGNVAQLSGHIDRVITAQQAGAYKPDRRLFDYAHEQLGVTKDDVVHICASPHLDHAAARDIGGSGASGSTAARGARCFPTIARTRRFRRSMKCRPSLLRSAGEPRDNIMAHTLSSVSSVQSAGNRRLDSDEIVQARIELAACFQLAAQLGFEEGICNHFSAVVPGHDDLFFVNPYGYAFSEVTASRILICDFDGNVIEGDGKPEATAFYIHARLHRLMPRVKAAFHTHMPNATALCLLEGPPLLWLGQTALKFYGRTAVVEDYNGLALDESEGDRIAAALGDADILFLKNHGVMVAGASIAEAWDDLYYLERAAEVQLKAMSANRPLKPVPADIAQRAYEQMRLGDKESARAHLDSAMRELRRRGVAFEA